MSWNLEGKSVTVITPKGTLTGYVLESRVAYGLGRIKHYVELDDPIDMFGAVREVISVEGEDILEVLEDREVA